MRPEKDREKISDSQGKRREGPGLGQEGRGVWVKKDASQTHRIIYYQS